MPCPPLLSSPTPLAYIESNPPVQGEEGGTPLKGPPRPQAQLNPGELRFHGSPWPCTVQAATSIPPLT